ncbi:MAG TPA: ABC transporter permease [Candidatus Acidoferrales bacterium]|nr:ABC transporter permease [Candidatus Acidoferrales bacterium]
MIEDFATVYAAEIARRIRSRPFIFGLVIGVLGITLLTRLPTMMGDAFSGSSTIVLLGDPSLTARAKPLLEKEYTVAQVLPDQPVDETLLKRDHAGAAFVLGRAKDGLHVVVYARDPGSMGQRAIARALLPLQLEITLNRSAAEVGTISRIPVTVQPLASKFTSANQAAAVRGIAYTLIFFLYLLILLNSQLVMSSVAEEKTSRIAELLVASVNPTALLTGKILSSATLGLLQLAAWIATATFLGGNGIASDRGTTTGIFSFASALEVITPLMVVAFLVYFLVGFLQLATLFAAAASLINRTEDLGSITMPLVLPVVAAFFIAIATLGAPDTPLSVACSYIPVLSPFVMFARIAVSNVPVWQIALSLAINLAALYLIALFAGKVYRVGMLLYGRAPSLKQIWSVLAS